MLRAVAILVFWSLVVFAAQFSGPPAVAVGWNRFDPANQADGNLATFTDFNALAMALSPTGLIVLREQSRIRRIGLDGRVTTVISEYVGNGPIAVDRQDNIYYGSSANPGGIYKVTPAGSRLPIAGGGNGALGEGLPALGTGSGSSAIAVNTQGEVIFAGGHRVWRIDTSGLLNLVAGTGTPGVTGEGGPATSAQLSYPSGLAVDASGALYIMDFYRIVRVGQDGRLTSLPLPLQFPSQPITGGTFTIDAAGNIYFFHPIANRIFRLATDGSVTTFGGTGSLFFPSCDTFSDVTSSLFGLVSGLAVNPAGDLLVLNGGVREITQAGAVRRIAGGPPSFSGDGGPASAATLNQPHGVAFDGAGSLYIADTGNNRIRQVTPDGIIHTIAGDGGLTASTPSGCVTDNDTLLRLPEAVAVDTAGNIYIADSGKHRVMKLAPDRTLTRIAGTGVQGFVTSPIGVLADSIPLNTPHAVGVDRDGNVYVGDQASRTLKIGADGTIVNVLQGVRAQAFSVDPQGNLYLTSGFVSYLVTADDKLIPVAGLGLGAQTAVPTNYQRAAYRANYPANDLDSGSGLTRDADGVLYSADFSGVALISPACNITLLKPGAGNLVIGPGHLAASPLGDVYLSDRTASVIWRLPHLDTRADDPTTPQLSVAPVRHAGSLLASTGGFNLTQGKTTIFFSEVVSQDVAPGEIVHINGQCLGPFEAVSAKRDLGFSLPTTLSGTSVTIGGVPVPLLSVQAGEIIAVTPFGLLAGSNADVQVTVGGSLVSDSVHVQPAVPSLFHFSDLNGASTAVATNIDGTMNSLFHPALRGSVVSLYATGFGQTDPASIDGEPVGAESRTYLITVGVMINGVPAEVLRTGPAVGFTGLARIDIRVPDTITGPVALTVGDTMFPPEAQLWIR